MAVFNNQITFILDAEVHPHTNFCQVAGVRYEDLQYEPLAPSAHHYTRHMLDVAQRGSFGEILAVCSLVRGRIWKSLITLKRIFL